MTPRLLVGAALATLLLSASSQAAPAPVTPLKSGPPVGATNNRSGFVPQFITGPTTGMRLCPV
jgi:hypothetical protein